MSSAQGARTAATAGERATARQTWSLLWHSSRPLSLLVILWSVTSALSPALVVGALGFIVGYIPDAVTDGLNSAAGHRLIASLVIAALIYGLSLVLDPIGNALSTAARTTVTSQLQSRLLAAVSGPIGIGHLEDQEVLDRLARAQGSLTGFFPGDAPVTWVGVLAARVSGAIGCLVVAVFVWWLGLGLLLMWFLVRRIVLSAVLRQATQLRGQATVLRRAWYFIGVGTKARDAKEVRVFGLDGYVTDQYRTHQDEAIAAGTQGLRQLHRRALGCYLVVLAAFCTALTLLAHQARSHEISLRTLAIVLPMLAVTMALGSVSMDDITLAWTMAGLPDVDRLETDLGRAVVDLPGRSPIQPAAQSASTVRFEQVHFRYPGAARDVLAGVDLELAAGTSTAIVGVNGAGKSTLVSLISRLRDPSGGRITVDGVDVRDLAADRWQRTVAIMPQEPVRYPVSAYDNIAFGAIEFRDDQAGVEAAAQLSGFAEVIDSLPAGWQTVLAPELPGGVNLSGGQWQRLALARCLFATRHQARLLVLDEPTAALDVRSEAQFYARFLQITGGLTTVVISHRFATVRRADVICVLDGGVITERGSHQELVSAGGPYAQMYQVQAARFAGRSQ
jgi:ATP-binding cassette, subfamily B, bacterial